MADTHVAASCSIADILSAQALCTPGDTLSVPAGTLEWAGPIVFTKGIKVIAAGIGATVITSTYTPPDYDRLNSTIDDFLVRYTPSDATANIPFQLSGFEFIFSVPIGGVELYDPTGNVQSGIRINHNKFTNVVRPIQIDGNFWGVADNNQGTCVRATIGTSYVNPTPFGSYGDDYRGWRTVTFDLGTGNNFFFEDNTFSSYGMFAHGGAGGRYCVRYNTLTYTNQTENLYPCFDYHGNTSASHSSQMGAEIYGNVIDLGARSTGGMFDGRGGKAAIFNNTVITSGDNPGQGFREEEHDNTSPGQPNNTISGQPMHVSDSYVWENRRYPGGSLISMSSPSTVNYADPGVDGYSAELAFNGVVPAEDKDYWVQKEPFTGVSGMGVGLLSARPMSGLVVGVGYWATDTQVLYRATSASTWQAFYTPYTYPHPLRSQSPDPGEPAVLVLPNNSIGLAASSPTLAPTANYYLTVAAASLALDSDRATLTPIEATPWDIRLGPSGSEVMLPALNWPSGSSPEMPEGTTIYVDSVALADGTIRHNFRTYSPRTWTFEWARLSEAEVAIFDELVAYNEPLHFQNKWVSADWHWVIITACDPVPVTGTFTTGTPFWKLRLELEEIL